MRKFIPGLFLLCVSMAANAAVHFSVKPLRIITLNGPITEIVDALGYGKSIVATDITSTYPAYIVNLPKVSKDRTVSSEGLISYMPDLVIAPEGSVSLQIATQLKAAGIKLVTINQQFSVDGTMKFIRDVAKVLNAVPKGEQLVKATQLKVNKALAAVDRKKQPKVLFIYARGAGTMFVSGKNTHVDEMITLCGGKNAVQEFDDFKPYTTEALVKANPDVILMFDFGFDSLGGSVSILKMPGVMQTNAGKNKKIVEMDSGLLINFGVRLDQSITELTAKLK